MAKKIVVLYGGISPEREVSLLSGKAVIESLKSLGYDVFPIDSSSSTLVSDLIKISPDVCYIALHGSDGEDGTIQALLDLLKIPYTTSGMKSSVLAMDKYLSKQVWYEAGMDVPKALYLIDENIATVELEYPVVVKPTMTGSSIGISKVEDKSQLADAFALAKKEGAVIVEKWIYGKELTVTVIEDEVFASVLIEPKNEFYDYESKYSGQSTYSCPSGLSDEDESRVRNLAKKAYDVLGCKGHARVDFIYESESDKFYLVEINTSPGMTEHSLSPKSVKGCGYSFDDLNKLIIEKAKL